MDIIISAGSDVPIYAQIARQVTDAILNGEISEGDPLPSIRTLASALQISSITTKRAYEELERGGYIITQIGRGSFVGAQNAELLRERRVKQVEEKLSEAVETAKRMGMPIREIVRLIEILYEEEM